MNIKLEKNLLAISGNEPERTRIMLLEDLLAIKGDCELLIWEAHPDIQKFLQNPDTREKIKQRLERVNDPAESEYRRQLINRLQLNYENYVNTEMSKLMDEDPLDVEIYFLYLLYHAYFSSPERFPELFDLISRMKNLLNKTYERRKKSLKRQA